MSVTLDVDDEAIPGLDADGRPDPAYAERLGLVPAPADRRSVAFLTDAAGFALLAIPTMIGLAQLTGAIVAVGGDVSGLDPAAAMPSLILVLVGQGLTTGYGLVQLILHGRTGRTLGKAAFGLRSVGVARFGVPGFWRVVLRALVLWLAQLVLPVAGPAIVFASSTWDPERRGRSWLDRLGSCWVIDVRHGLDPLDAKALRHARRALEAPAASAAQRLPSLATDRPLDEHTFIPASRSSSGVVADGHGDGWTPPPLNPAAVAPAGPTPAGAPAVAAAAVASPVAPIAPPAASPRASMRPADLPSFVLVFDDGTRLDTRSSGLIGRDPAGAPGEDAMRRVPIADAQMRISKTHLAFGVDADGAWVMDRASKNGTFLEPPGGEGRRLEPWVREHPAIGSTVRVGGRSFVIAAEGADR
ncbi:RDD family protein [Agromyces bauzanensis]